MTKKDATELFANFYKNNLFIGKVPILLNRHTKINDDIIFDVVTIEQYLNKLPNKFPAGQDGTTILLKKIGC